MKLCNRVKYDAAKQVKPVFRNNRNILDFDTY